LGQDERRGLGGKFSHLGQQFARLAVVGDPLLVEVGLALGEALVDGLAVDLGGEVPVGPVQTRRVAFAGAVLLATAVGAQRNAARRDEADVRQLPGELFVAALIRRQWGDRRRGHAPEHPTPATLEYAY
jgi:hypothetical protein